VRNLLRVVYRWLAVCVLAVAAGAAWAQHPGSHQHGFQGAEQWSQVFDDPARDAWQKPDEIIRALALKPDATVADIGAGTGYLAVRVARAVPKGKVYGVDLERDMVRYLAERAKREKIDNLVAIAGAPDSPRLPTAVDLMILLDVYHHIDARERYFRALAEKLKPGGRIAVIDFLPDAPMGPPRSARVPAAEVQRELTAAGYHFVQKHEFLPHQYFLVFARP
jgi:cyclopropane fatty-acyl-phospholipid synthase-like methyltransferase